MMLKIGNTEIECTSTDKFSSNRHEGFLPSLNQLTEEDISQNQKALTELFNLGEESADSALSLIAIVESVEREGENDFVKMNCGLGATIEAKYDGAAPYFVTKLAKVKVNFHFPIQEYLENIP